MVRHPNRLQQLQPSHPGHGKGSAGIPRLRRSLHTLGKEVSLYSKPTPASLPNRRHTVTRGGLLSCMCPVSPNQQAGFAWTLQATGRGKANTAVESVVGINGRQGGRPKIIGGAGAANSSQKGKLQA